MQHKRKRRTKQTDIVSQVIFSHCVICGKRRKLCNMWPVDKKQNDDGDAQYFDYLHDFDGIVCSKSSNHRAIRWHPLSRHSNRPWSWHISRGSQAISWWSLYPFRGPMWSTSIRHFSSRNSPTICWLAWWTWFPWVLTTVSQIFRVAGLSLRSWLRGILQWFWAQPHICRSSMVLADRNFESLANLNRSTVRIHLRRQSWRPHIADNAWKCIALSNVIAGIVRMPETSIRRCSARVRNGVHCCTLDVDTDSLVVFWRWDGFRVECLWCSWFRKGETENNKND